MLLNELPKYIQPVKLCRTAPLKGTQLSGDISLCNLNDLNQELKSQKNAIVSVSLNFSTDGEGICCIKGDLAVNLSLICQRCLQPMDYFLESSFQVSPVASDQEAQHLPSRYEPLLTHDGEISLAEWIAEEIHLALPLAPRHEPSCVSYDTKDEGDESGSNSPGSPFAKLADLK